jgi:glucose/arabinose dehydrogenase
VGGTMLKTPPTRNAFRVSTSPQGGGETRKHLRGLTSITLALLVSATLPAIAADMPGQSFNISPASLPKPHATPAVDNTSKKIPRPAGALPQVTKGFAVSVFATGLEHARWLAVAPNGDVFLSQSDLGRVTVLRPSPDGAKAKRVSVFAAGFTMPHGLAFHDGALYVADLKSVWRIPYKNGALKGGKRTRVTHAEIGGTGHFTRDIVFAPNGDLFLTIGAANNMGEDPLPRASVQKVKTDGTLTTFASGLRNPVGIAFYPDTDDLFVTVNERDGLGDGLVPDYLTRIAQGDFFGWPYAYTGKNPDPDYGAKRPDLVARSKTPDLLFQSHSAPLGLVFYEGDQFPAAYKGDAFVALHGSWNSAKPTGYKVVRVKFTGGKPAGGYENFLTGFWDGSTSPAQVWGRPVGLAVAKDGSLLVADDAGGTVWRVAYTGK